MQTKYNWQAKGFVKTKVARNKNQVEELVLQMCQDFLTNKGKAWVDDTDNLRGENVEVGRVHIGWLLISQSRELATCQE